MGDTKSKRYEENQGVGGGYLMECGPDLISNGYNIVPIQPGAKKPGFDDWQKTKATKTVLSNWFTDGMGRYGVGILTKTTPAVDIDVHDEDLVRILEDYCIEHMGAAPIRVGKEPKKLLLYRTEKPFKKITSKTYLNDWNERCRIEILGDGQQFVAFHIHPQTKKPYRWTTEATPLTVAADELPEIDLNVVRDLVKLFEAEAEKLGWKQVRSMKRRIEDAKAAGEIDHDDPFAADVQPITMAVEELRQRLMLCPGADDYDTWLQVGMALYHQFDGEEEGRDMWHEWSETASNYDPAALDAKWSTFDVSDKGFRPVTARLILELAKEATETQVAALFAELKDRFTLAKERGEWQAVAKDARKAEIDHVSRSALAIVARKSMEEITGQKVPIYEVKKALAYEPAKAEMPKWCRHWIYDSSDDRFFHMDTKILASLQGFNAINGRHALSKTDIINGRTAPSQTAVDLALNLYHIPLVAGRRYAPGADSLFFRDGLQFGNTYDEMSVPPKVGVIRPIDKANIQIVKNHLAHLLPDEKERTMLWDWLTYVVQNPGQRINYAVLLQGVQGDGKSFFAFLLRAVMGVPNVRMATGSILESPFNGWAEGQCVCAIEEVRLIGHNRFDILNRMKPLVTNPVIEIHPKGRNPYNVENTSNYLLFTNYQNALPLDENERRYLVLFSQWQSRESLGAFKLANPDYYLNLYQAIYDSAPAIRSWMLSRNQSESFNPAGDAPITPYFYYMVKASIPDEMKNVHEIIDDSDDPEVSPTLLNITKLQEIIAEGDFDGEVPYGRALQRQLEYAGYWPIGRVRVGTRYDRYYSKTPNEFRLVGDDGKWRANAAAVLKYLRSLNKEEDEDDEL